MFLHTNYLCNKLDINEVLTIAGHDIFTHVEQDQEKKDTEEKCFLWPHSAHLNMPCLE